MLKAILTVWVTLAAIFCLHGQDPRKFWHDGRLQWSDFHQTLSGEYASELRYTLGFKQEKFRTGDTIIQQPTAFAFVNRPASAVNPQFRNEQHLRYNQVVFDILESHRRQLQYELFRANSHSEANQALQLIHTQADEEIQRFQRESQGGHNLQVTEVWETLVALKINRLGEQTPFLTLRRFGLGFHAGFGTGLLSGTMGNHFGLPFSFVFGYDFWWNKISLMTSFALSGGKTRETYTGPTHWQKGERANLALLDFSLGYQTYSAPKWRVTPYLGLGINEFSEPTTQKEVSPQRMVSYRYSAGVCIDYRLVKMLNLQPNPLLSTKEFSEIGIRTRLSVSRADFYPDLNGFTYTLSVGISGLWRGLRVE
jgi:hypothetical protein